MGAGFTQRSGRTLAYKSVTEFAKVSSVWTPQIHNLSFFGISLDPKSSESLSLSLSSCSVSLSLCLSISLYLSTYEGSHWSFTNLILAINPPESSWPRSKPKLVSNRGVLRCFNTGRLQS